MAGERNLKTLLRAMSPLLHGEEFVFCTRDRPAGHPICAFRETEGWTLVLRREEAERLGIPFVYPCRLITLTAHSSLEAVGFLAAIAAEMSKRGISLNVVSAYYHDHLFVAVDRAEDAMAALRTLAGSA